MTGHDDSTINIVVVIIPAKAFARIMESPALVCLSVCLFVTTITK